MSKVPGTKTASAPARTPANKSRNDGDGHSVSNPVAQSEIQGQGAHAPLEAVAIRHASRIIRSAMDYGWIGPLDVPPETMPTPELERIAKLSRKAHDQGLTEFPDFVGFILDQPITEAEKTDLRIKIAEIGEPPLSERPGALEVAVQAILDFDRLKRIQVLEWKLRDALESREDPTSIIQEMNRIATVGTATNHTLRERAYTMRFDPEEEPPPDESCMMIGDVPIAARGNLTVIQGKSKVGKSALVSAIIGAAHRGEYQAQGDTLCVSWSGESTGAIIHLDTEQSRSDWHGLVARSITRSGLHEVSERLVSLPLVMFARSERLAILRATLHHEQASQGKIDAVMIDGIADLCKSPNDEAEALELVSNVHALSQEFSCTIYCVLHENPSSEGGKTRGHLGSELNRKAFANLRIDKDAEGLSTIYGTDMRKRDIPKDQGFCFGWNDKARMHTFQGRASGLKAAQREQKSTAEAQEYWRPIFQHLARNRENGTFPDVTVNLAIEAEREISGKEISTKYETMKKRLQRGEVLGVLRKSSPNEWTFIHEGKSGKEREE